MTRVLIVSHDVVGSRMAGPGIRYWELSRALARHHQVALACPNQTDLKGQGFRLFPYQRQDPDSLGREAQRAQVVVVCGDTLELFPWLKGLGKPLVVDLYDPFILENLELDRGLSPEEQEARHQSGLGVLRGLLEAGDFFLCANQRQRDFWLGMLAAWGRLSPRAYRADPSLEDLIAVVPFGLPSEPPRRSKPALKGVWPGIGPQDQVLLWGGGLWEWLDPLTAVRAAAWLRSRREGLRLFFMGTRHPNQAVPEMRVAAEARQLSQELGLLDKHVFFNDWVPYLERADYLLEADLGLSLHRDLVETRFSSRTRLLDYLWAGLPMVVTGGDPLAETVEAHGLGLVVDFQDAEGVGAAVLQLLERPRLKEELAPNFRRATPPLRWEVACQPLAHFCQDPRLSVQRQDAAPGSKGQSGPGPLARATARLAVTEEAPGRPLMELASVIVLSYNGRDYLGPCLSSLLASDYRSLEVLLVDNGSQDGSPSWVAQAFPEVRVVRNGRNLGFAGGMNRGIAQARGRFLAFLNQDTTVRPDWLGSLVRALVAGAGVAGSKIYYPDGRTLQHAGGIIRYPQALADHHGYRQPDQGQCDEPREVDYVTGAAFATGREVLEAIGTFDEGFHPAYFEDTDLCFRARKAGYRVLYVPEAVVVHHESATTVRDSYAYYRAYHGGRLRFVLKHYSAAQVMEDFYPAEQAWLAGVQSPDERRALRQAYQAASREPQVALAALTPEVSRLLGRLAQEAAGGQRPADRQPWTPGPLGRLFSLWGR